MDAEIVVTEQPAIEHAEPAPLSILEHAAVHGPGKLGETEEQATERIEKAHHSAEQRREKETGKFDTGKVRHRAESQKARAEDVPRIRELTGKLRAAEDELTRLRAAHAAPATIAKAEAKVETAAAKMETPKGATFTEPEPDENDPKFAGDYGKYLRAAAAWEGRKAYHDERHAEAQRGEQAKLAEQKAAQGKVWDDRIEKARAKYDDFDRLAHEVMQRIPEDSATEAWIYSHELGEDVLAYFHGHPQELDAILQMPSALKQFEALTLLSQRFASPTHGAAGSTTAAPERKATIKLPPPPATVVRTEAQRASDGPAPTDGTLSVMSHARTFRRS
jgi:hypothetical protein